MGRVVSGLRTARQARNSPRESSDVSAAPLRVGELNRAVRGHLERSFADVVVSGEIGDLSVAPSGHVYFCLNDSQEPAQLRAVMFRNDWRRTRDSFVNGSEAIARGTLSLYQPRGSFQLIVRELSAGGLGTLRAQFEKLRAKLRQEGLFEASRKRPLPRYPRVVGVVTSHAAAALTDVIKVTEGRCPTHLVVSGCQVQGRDAPASIAAALARLEQRRDVEAVIVTRGGGSAEDLVAYNDERVVRAIATFPVPTVSAVGHEVDITLADLVADVRAATPSNAAELVIPEMSQMRLDLFNQQRSFERALELVVGRKQLQLDRLRRRLQPDRRWRLAGEQLRSSGRRLQEAFLVRQRREQRRLQHLEDRIRRQDPRHALARQRTSMASIEQRLQHWSKHFTRGQAQQVHAHTTGLVRAANESVKRQHNALEALEGRLRSLSPLAVLERGYAIAFDAATGEPLLEAARALPGSQVNVRLHQGSLHTQVVSHEE